MEKRFIVERQGKDHVLFAGLLDQAHHEGLKRITTTLLQIPSPDNGQVAIVHAEVETEKGVFSGIGDASPQNVGRMIALHTIRMAETRAKARALRDAINVGATAFEELGPDEADDPAPRREVNRSTGELPYRPAPSTPVPVPHPPAAATAQAHDLATKEDRETLERAHRQLGKPVPALDAKLTHGAALAWIGHLRDEYKRQKELAR